jgi:hypothetical protein
MNESVCVCVCVCAQSVLLPQNISTGNESQLTSQHTAMFFKIVNSAEILKYT